MHCRGVLTQICPKCRDPKGDIVTDYVAGDVICRSCGAVIGDHVIDDAIEWRTFADGNPQYVWLQLAAGWLVLTLLYVQQGRSESHRREVQCFVGHW